MKNKLQLIVFSVLILGSICSCSQEINNNLLGLYVNERESYTDIGLEFDGNGNVNLMGETDGYFFTKGDSLIVFSNADILKFKIQGKKLIGVSDGIKNVPFVKKSTQISNKRTNNDKAKNTAMLLNEYYEIMKDNLSNDFTKNDKKTNNQKNKIIQLCDQGLSQACFSYFGIMVIEEQFLRTNPNAKKSINSENPEIVALGNKIINQGEIKGYGLLGIYYQVIGNQEKAMQQYKLGAKYGDKTSSLELTNMKMKNDPDNVQPIIKEPTSNKN